MKKVINLLTTSVMLLGIFAGCTQNQDKVEEKDTTEDTSLSFITEKGEFIIGLDDSFPPMGFRDEDNNIVGFDIDLANAVSEKLGVTLITQPIKWASKEMELETKNIDAIWNGMSISEERLEDMTMSDPYLSNEMVFVTLKDSSIKSLDDLEGKTIGVQTGSTAEGALEKSDVKANIKEVLGFSDNLTAFLDLETSSIDAVLIDSVVARYFITTSEKDFVVMEEELSTEQYGIGFRKDDLKLEEAVSDALLELASEGKIAEISTKWFGEDISLIGK